jgi:hypothetical protein
MNATLDAYSGTATTDNYDLRGNRTTSVTSDTSGRRMLVEAPPESTSPTGAQGGTAPAALYGIALSH